MRKASTFMIKTEYLVPTGKKNWGEKKIRFYGKTMNSKKENKQQHTFKNHNKTTTKPCSNPSPPFGLWRRMTAHAKALRRPQRSPPGRIACGSTGTRSQPAEHRRRCPELGEGSGQPSAPRPGPRGCAQQVPRAALASAGSASLTYAWCPGPGSAAASGQGGREDGGREAGRQGVREEEGRQGGGAAESPGERCGTRPGPRMHRPRPGSPRDEGTKALCGSPRRWEAPGEQSPGSSTGQGMHGGSPAGTRAGGGAPGALGGSAALSRRSAGCGAGREQPPRSLSAPGALRRHQRRAGICPPSAGLSASCAALPRVLHSARIPTNHITP